MVATAAGATAPTLRERAEAQRSQRFNGAAAHPVVRKILEQFPGAEIVDVTGPEAGAAAPDAAAAAPPAGDDDVAYADSFSDDDL